VTAARGFAIEWPPMAERTHAARAARARRGFGVVALARRRMRRGALGRTAAAFGALIAVGFAAFALVLRVSEGADASIEELLSAAGGLAAWLVGVPVALAAADDRAAEDLRDGIDALAAARGVSARSLEGARVLGAMVEATRALAVPLGALALFLVALAGSPARALSRLEFTLAILAFAALAGGTLGGLGAVCGALGRARGRLLFLAVLLGPWALAEAYGRPALSIPGALDAALDFALGGAGA
jgi:hypothetical protein